MTPGVILLLIVAMATALFGDVTVRYHAQMKYGGALPGAIGERTQNGVIGMPEDTEIYRKGDREFIRNGKFACLIDFTKQTITVIDDEHKQYATAKASDFVGQAAAALPPISSKYKDDDQRSKSSPVTSRKTGRTGKLHDVEIEETEYLVTVDVPPVPVPGFKPTSPALKIKLQVWTPASADTRQKPMVREMAELGLPDGRFSPVMDPAQIVAEVYSAMPGLLAGWDELLKQVAKDQPVILRYHLETSLPQLPELMKFQPSAFPPGVDVSAPIHQVDGEVNQVLPSVDESVFQIPAEYHQAPFADVMKAVSPGYPKS